MATTVSTDLDLTIKVVERETGIGSGQEASYLRHPIELIGDYGSGTGVNQNDVVYSITTTATGAAHTYDLDGLTSTLTGDAIAFAEITLIAVVNLSTTSTQTLTVGAGSNPLASWLGAAGDAVVVGPSGAMLVSSPIDGYAVTAGTGDTLTINPGAATITYRLLILGRSA